MWPPRRSSPSSAASTACLQRPCRQPTSTCRYAPLSSPGREGGWEAHTTSALASGMLAWDQQQATGKFPEREMLLWVPVGHWPFHNFHDFYDLRPHTDPSCPVFHASPCYCRYCMLAVHHRHPIALALLPSPGRPPRPLSLPAQLTGPCVPCAAACRVAGYLPPPGPCGGVHLT